MVSTGPTRVDGARSLISSAYARGVGIEVGAGDRPFPIPDEAKCLRGDIRNSQELKMYFLNENVVGGDNFIDAQSFSGVVDNSIDFCISAHVLEHLHDPFGSIKSAMCKLVPGGVLILIIPNKDYTFDRNRPLVSFEHLLQDMTDGGARTLREAYFEHCKYVHPVLTGSEMPDIEAAIDDGIRNKRDIHVHAWSHEHFFEQMEQLGNILDFKVIFSSRIENEANFVLKKV